MYENERADPECSTHPLTPSLEGRGKNRVESRTPIDRPLDVLVQHLVTLAAGDGFVPDQLLQEVRSTHAYADLTDEQWGWALDFVMRGGQALRAYPQYARVVEREGRCVVASRPIERLHRMSIGTITSDSAVQIAYVKGAVLGTMEESFISKLRPGDRFIFAGRVLELVRVHNMVAQVRNARQSSGVVPRWMGSRSPLSTLLGQAIRHKLDEARRGIFIGPEMQLVRPLLELQAAWSVIPAPDELLIERVKNRAWHHVFVFSFEGLLVHEGLSSLIAHRIMRERPCTMHVTATDWGFELLSRSPIDLDEAQWRKVFDPENLVRDLFQCLNTTSLARRHFREVARVAGLLFPGFPGQSKTARQLQASSEMFYEVFSQFDPDNLLLDQAKREALDRELEVARLHKTLQRIDRSRLVIVDAPRLTPLGFPIWVDSMRVQQMSSERWADRVKRMVVRLETEAQKAKTPKRQNAKTSKRSEAVSIARIA